MKTGILPSGFHYVLRVCLQLGGLMALGWCCYQLRDAVPNWLAVPLVIVAIPTAYVVPGLLMELVPARCRSCGGAAYLAYGEGFEGTGPPPLYQKTLKFPVSYDCSACGHQEHVGIE